MTGTVESKQGSYQQPTEDHEHHAPRGVKRWLFSTSHKDIGTLYLGFSLLMFLIGGAMAMLIRAELFQPGLQLIEPDFYNQMTTVHGLIMVFGGVFGFCLLLLPCS